MAESTEYSLRSKFPIVVPSSQVMSALSHQRWVAQAFKAFRGVGLWSSHNLMNTLLLALTALYVCWRLWKFTIQPYLRPEAPKELPYWIPCKFKLLVKRFELTSIIIVLGSFR